MVPLLKFISFIPFCKRVLHFYYFTCTFLKRILKNFLKLNIMKYASNYCDKTWKHMENPNHAINFNNTTVSATTNN